MKNKRNIRFEIRLSDEEYKLFKQKAARYQTVSSMIRDAVKQFDDTATRGKIESLTEIKNYYTRFDQRLGWLGGNINQAQKRANELAIAGQLTPEFLQRVTLPKIKEALKLIYEMKSKQDAIYSKLIGL